MAGVTIKRKISRRQILKIKKDVNNNVDIEIDKKEFIKIYNSYVKIANKRLERIEKNDYIKSSPAYRHIESLSGGKLVNTETRFRKASKDISYSDLINNLKKLDDFLFIYKTSTITGIEKHNKNIVEKSIKALKVQNNELAKYVEDIYNQKDKSSKEISNELSYFWSSSIIGKLTEIFGSDVAVEIYNDISNNVDYEKYELNSELNRYIDKNGYTKYNHPAVYNFIMEASSYLNNLKLSSIDEEDVESVNNI